MPFVLTTAQIRALDQVTARARASARPAAEQVTALLAGRDDRAARAQIAAHARVTLSFHPDRLLADGRSVAEGLAESGVYKSQFETGVSNGSLSAHPGGDRDRWEEQLFGGAYHDGGVPAGDRPKYGGLNLLGHADGASPRFGSCYFRLRPSVLGRCTFTWGDSHAGPAHVGTITAFDAIWAALLAAVTAGGAALGQSGLAVDGLLARLEALDAAATDDPARGQNGRALDDYIEAQVHGEVRLDRDVEALVIDPSFAGTPTEALLEETCARHGIAWQRHPGFVLATADVPADFRGPRMVPLAARIDGPFAGVPGRLDAATVGRAAASFRRDPAAWADWGAPAETLQHLKQLWHVLVRYGAPAPG